jgi:hypothetical protein
MVRDRVFHLADAATNPNCLQMKVDRHFPHASFGIIAVAASRIERNFYVKAEFIQGIAQ